ncbi:hypothetical protein J2T38_001718 [Neisseria perflava]|uniref:BRO family protein n=1 Tax=Neisseria perflava TaxID=33053 RepID=UPI0020A17FBE|nr:BRO family protein [Neisseria perflava]MCP1772882.1 hypothetical protein [Neisseria perflava]
MNALVQQFNPSKIAVTDHNGHKWLTAEQLGLALGFSVKRARDGVNNLYNRHIDEFSEQDSTTIKLMAVDGKQRETRIFSFTGCNLLSFFANTPNAKAFRAWAKVKLAGPAADTAAYEKLKAAFLESSPETAKLVRYHEMGLGLSEIGKLLDMKPGSVAYRLKKLNDLGFTAYTPDPELSARGRLGYKAMMDAQQSLGLEG